MIDSHPLKDKDTPPASHLEWVHANDHTSSMSVLTSLFPPHTSLFWSCVGLYADAVKICSPSKKLQRLAEEIARFSRKPPETAIESFTRGMNEATTLAEYEKCAIALDHLEGHETWKAERQSIETGYNPDVIESQVVKLSKAVASRDLNAMQHLLRTGLSRDLGGMNMLRLYKHSWFGTKFQIDEYINTVLETIETFADTAIRNNVPPTEVRVYQQSLEDALKFFGRSALTLSGGAVLGMKHIGVVKTLWEAELLPEIISGASAGAIVAGIVGSSSDEHMTEVLETFPYGDLAVFDTPGTTRLGWCYQRVSTYLRTGAFFDMTNLKRVLREWLGDITFREAHYKTGRILNICVSSVGSAEPRLLNYVTAPDVFVWSAVCASCAVPNVFSPVNIYEKDAVTKEPRVWMQAAQQTFVDGSLDHDIPMRKLSEIFNVNCFIVSQVNPHVRAFLGREEAFRGQQPKTPERPRSMFQGSKTFLRQEIIHRAQQMADLGFPERFYRWASVFNQQYTGDINILPEIGASEYLSLMMNPSAEFMVEASASGERATWPRMSRIKNCVAIELALLQAIHRLRDRVNFGPEARAAREERRRSNSNGRPGRGRSARPSFLRRRSLSIEAASNGEQELNLEALTSNKSLSARRNYSLGHISMKPTFSITTPRSTPFLPPPQVGLDQDMFGDGFMMMRGSNASEESDL